MQPTLDGAIHIRPMGDDLVTTLCLHHGPLAAAQLRQPSDNHVDARLLHRLPVKRQTPAAVLVIFLLARHDVLVLAAIVLVPQAGDPQ